MKTDYRVTLYFLLLIYAAGITACGQMAPSLPDISQSSSSEESQDNEVRRANSNHADDAETGSVETVEKKDTEQLSSLKSETSTVNQPSPILSSVSDSESLEQRPLPDITLRSVGDAAVTLPISKSPSDDLQLNDDASKALALYKSPMKTAFANYFTDTDPISEDEILHVLFINNREFLGKVLELQLLYQFDLSATQRKEYSEKWMQLIEEIQAKAIDLWRNDRGFHRFSYGLVNVSFTSFKHQTLAQKSQRHFILKQWMEDLTRFIEGGLQPVIPEPAPYKPNKIGFHLPSIEQMRPGKDAYIPYVRDYGYNGVERQYDGALRDLMIALSPIHSFDQFNRHGLKISTQFQREQNRYDKRPWLDVKWLEKTITKLKESEVLATQQDWGPARFLTSRTQYFVDKPRNRIILKSVRKKERAPFFKTEVQEEQKTKFWSFDLYRNSNFSDRNLQQQIWSRLTTDDPRPEIFLFNVRGESLLTWLPQVVLHALFDNKKSPVKGTRDFSYFWINVDEDFLSSEVPNINRLFIDMESL